MAERDDDLARRYRSASREEPPPALDAAILAASRRAVGARPGAVRRWAGPVSIAAVLMLGVGVTLRMQQERPGIDSAMPASEYQMPDPSASIAEAPVQASKPSTAAASPEPQPVAPAKPSASTAEAPRALQRREEPEAPRAKVAKPATDALTPATAAPPAALGVQSAPAPAERAKRETSVASRPMESRTLSNTADPRVTELERIAKLRADGRNDEADRALEEFRRVHRDYRIPEAMWERVRPR